MHVPLAFGMPAAPEWIFIGILALILFGPKKLPDLARGFGKAMGELQKAKEDFHRVISGVPPMPRIEPPTGMEVYKATTFPESTACDSTLLQDANSVPLQAQGATLTSGVTHSLPVTPDKVPSANLVVSHDPTSDSIHPG